MIPEPQDSNRLTDHQKETLRAAVIASCRPLLNVPYHFGAEWTDYSRVPDFLDCSELVEGVFKINGLKMPDGSQNQYTFCLHADLPKPGDLGFFGRGGNPGQIYHVGLLIDPHTVIEARGLDPGASFPTGCVILRPRAKWEAYLPQFVGWRAHPKLI